MLDSTFTGSTDVLVRGFKALGDPTRLRILAVLTTGPRCACDIQTHVGVASNLLSHHLKVLRDAGLVHGRKRGRWIDYEIVTGKLDDLVNAVPPTPESVDLDLRDDATCPTDATCAGDGTRA